LANLIDGGSVVDEKEGSVLVWFERAKVEHRVALVAANLKKLKKKADSFIYTSHYMSHIIF
jgi:hypothetical protein